MQLLRKSLKVLGIIAGVALVFVGLSLISPRKSLLDWMVLSVALLSVVTLRELKFKWWCTGAVLAGIALAFSPVDFVIRSGPGQFGFRLMPVHFGLVSPEGTVNYGCTLQRNPPRKALVLFL